MGARIFIVNPVPEKIGAGHRASWKGRSRNDQPRASLRLCRSRTPGRSSGQARGGHCCHPAYSECPLEQLHYLTQLVRPGDIVLTDRCGDTRHACWGGVITTPLRAGNDPKPAQVRFCRPCRQRAS